jgi:plasmid stabilization system protein ParE
MAKKIRVVVAESTRRDLAEILDYVKVDSPRSARKLIQEIYKRFNKLPSFPKLGRIIPEIGDSFLREIVVGPYRMMYRLEENKLIVLRILHGKRFFLGNF